MKRFLLMGLLYSTILTISATDSCTISVRCEPAEGGVVLGAGTYERGTKTHLQAKSNSTYRFLGWTDGNSVNPRNILVLTDTTYTARFARQTEYVPKQSASVRLSYDNSKLVRDTAFVTVTPATPKKARKR